MLVEEGEADTEAQVRVFSDLLRNKALRPPFRVLIDRRGITEVWGREEVQVAADRLAGVGTNLVGARMAVLVRREVAFGMVRMLQAYTEELPMTVRAFYEEAEALEWLQDDAV